MTVPGWPSDGTIASDARTAGISSVDLDLTTGGVTFPYSYPGDVQAGDLLILATVSCDPNPVGFTHLASVGFISVNTGILDVSYKVAVGGETAVSVPTVANNGSGAYLRIRGARPLLHYADDYFDAAPSSNLTDTGATLTPTVDAANVRITLPSPNFVATVDTSTDPEDRMMASTGGGAFTDGVAIVGRRVTTGAGVPIPGATYTAAADGIGKTMSFLISMSFSALQIGAVAIG